MLPQKSTMVKLLWSNKCTQIVLVFAVKAVDPVKGENRDKLSLGVNYSLPAWLKEVRQSTVVLLSLDKVMKNL